MAQNMLGTSREHQRIFVRLPWIMAVLVAMLSMAQSRSVSGSSAFHRLISVSRTLDRTVPLVPLSKLRGGSTEVEVMEENDNADEDEEDDEDEDDSSDITKHPDFAKLQAYRMQQQILLQNRAQSFTQLLHLRGVRIPTWIDAHTPESTRKAAYVDWDCAYSTMEDEDDDKKRTCIVSFNPPPGTKLVVPMGSKDWISIYELNNMRRSEEKKVDGLWHEQYSVLKGWFKDLDSEFSFHQHTGPVGLFLHHVLEGYTLQFLTAVVVLTMIYQFLPFLLPVLGRILVSGELWMSWPKWSRFVHSALPMKMLMGQLLFQFLAHIFGKLVTKIRTYLVEWESNLLESKLPITTGPGSGDPLLGDEESDIFFDAEEEAVFDEQDDDEAFFDAQEEEEFDDDKED